MGGRSFTIIRAKRLGRRGFGTVSFLSYLLSIKYRVSGMVECSPSVESWGGFGALVRSELAEQHRSVALLTSAFWRT